MGKQVLHFARVTACCKFNGSTGANPAKAGFAPILVIYTTMMMKQYHYKHFYANLDFDHFS